MQSTGGAVELVERSEGGFGVSCSTTLFVLSFRGVASGGPPGAPAAGFFSYGCGAVVRVVVFSWGCLRRPSGSACGGLLFVRVWCGSESSVAL